MPSIMMPHTLKKTQSPMPHTYTEKDSESYAEHHDATSTEKDSESYAEHATYTDDDDCLLVLIQ